MRKKKINMYCGDQYGYKQGMIHELLNRGAIDFCLTDYIPDKGGEPPAVDDRIVTVNHGPSLSNKYDRIVDINDFPALSGELMEAMLPYESMAIKMGMRFSNYPIIDYEEEKRNYYIHLRYWNYMLEKYNINYIYLNDAPHAQGKYVVYALAKIKKIPIFFLTYCNFDSRLVYGDDIFTIGDHIGKKYFEIKEKDVSGLEMTGSVKSFYDRYSGGIDAVKERVNPGNDKGTKKLARSLTKISYGKYSGKTLYTTYPKMFFSILTSSLKRGSLSYLRDDRGVELRHTKHLMHAIRFYRKNLGYSVKDYNKMAVMPDYSEKYIYFALQLTPEATTLPRAGVFSEQYNSIQLMAKIAEKNGMYLYIKEHYVQVTRTRDFYDDIRKIKNVRLINTAVNAMDLVAGSVAVVTHTGTVMLEAAMLGKPTLVLGRGYFYKNMPGVFEVDNETDGAKTLAQLAAGYEHDYDEVKKYFCAIELSTVETTDKASRREYLISQGVKSIPKDGITQKADIIQKNIEEAYN